MGRIDDLRALLSRHWQARARHPGQACVTSTRALFRDGRPATILTKTAQLPQDGGWLTLMALASEWTRLTGEALPDDPRAN